MLRSCLVCLGASLLFGCRSMAVERSHLEQELLAAHAAVLRNHRELDWRALTGEDSSADVTLSVSRGQVHEVTRRAAEERFKGYFEAARFSRYEDLAAPIVRVSEDGTLGWVIAKVRMEGVYHEQDGEVSRLDSTWGWIELYERSAGRWLRVGTVSGLDRNTSPEGLAGVSYLVEPECAQVLMAAEAALGGYPALAAVLSIDATASVLAPGGRGQLRVQAMADGRVLLEQETTAGTQVVMRALHGETWIGAGADSLPGTDAQRCFTLGHALHLTLLSPTRIYADARIGADVEFAGRKARSIDCTDNLGAPVQLYYDADTGLPLGMLLVEPGSDPALPILFTVDDWRALGTLQVFYSATILHRGNRYEYEYTAVDLNAVPGSQFRRPDQASAPE